jgi:hypothetical protein
MSLERKFFPNIGQNPDLTKDTNPIIEIGEKRDFLTEKLTEYRERLIAQIKQEHTSGDMRDTIYKITILEDLLKPEGIANTFEISKKLAQGDDFSVKIFNDACSVIEQYTAGNTKLKKGDIIPKTGTPDDTLELPAHRIPRPF